MEVGSREFKNRVGAYLDRVEHGDMITVTRRGKPVATLVPASVENGLTQLIAEGKMRWNGGKPKLAERPLRKSKGKPLSDYVVEGRR